MRFLADMAVHRLVVDWLQDQGHQVAHPSGREDLRALGVAGSRAMIGVVSTTTGPSPAGILKVPL